MKKGIPLKVVILSYALILFPLNGAAVMSASDAGKWLPKDSDIGGWQLSENHHYLPENLYNYINGAADLFISYGFVKLVGADYVRGPGKEGNLVVDIYDMGSKLNAFGIFQSKRDPASKSLKIGAGAFGGKRYVFFYKDHFYVEIQSYLPSGKDGDMAVMMAQKVAGEMPGNCMPPVELNYLPDVDKITGSEMYITGGILGHAFLDKGLVSDYKTGDSVVKAFVAFFPSREHAVKALDRYKKYINASGETWQPLNGFGEMGFSSKEPYQETVLVVQMSHFVVGVSNLSHADKGKELLKRIMREVKRSIEPNKRSGWIEFEAYV